MNKIIITLFVIISFSGFAQDDTKKTENKKSKNIGEKIGNLAGNLMVSKTDNLSNIALTINVVNGIYDMRTKTTETKYYPEGTTEGDNSISVSLFKNGGTGLYKLKGEVLCDGQPTESVGLGSYVFAFKEPWSGSKKITIRAENGDTAQFIVKSIPPIEIVSMNKDKILPIIDLADDLVLEYFNPTGSDSTEVNAGLLTEIMGVRAFNNFANFPAKNTTITIPSQAFSNLAVSGQMGAGQITKGANWFALERLKRTEKSQLGPEQKPGNLPSVTILTKIIFFLACYCER